MKVEPKFRMPLGRSLAMTDRAANRPVNASVATVERVEREAARKFAATVGDALSSVRFRADTFSAHLEGFVRTSGASELIEAANDRSKPHVAQACQGVLHKAGVAGSPHAHHAQAVATALREAFAEAKRGLADAHQRWGEEHIDTPEAREQVQAIVTRMHAAGVAAITFLGHVGDQNGQLLGREARTLYQDLTDTAHDVVANFDQFEAGMKQAPAKTAKGGMRMS